jgi:hypothetical protein
MLRRNMPDIQPKRLFIGRIAAIAGRGCWLQLHKD